MKKMKSFRRKLLLTVILPVSFVIVSWNLFLGWYFVKYQKKLMEEELLSVAGALTILIETEMQGNFWNLEKLEGKIREGMDKSPSISSIHILERKDNGLHVVAGLNKNIDDEPILSVGSLYPFNNFPGALMGFVVPFVVKGKNYLTGYVPLRDRDGNSVALLRLKYKIDKNFRLIYLQMLGVSLFLVFLFVLFGFFVSRQILVPLHSILAGIENIQRGNLDCRLIVESEDEFGQIVRAFNKMVNNLNMSRKVLQNYFYRTIRSLVTIIESKDSYTKGHSERVAVYAEKIARRMSVPEKKLNLLRDVALLHDIGKLGIEQTILQKTDTLTEEEWNIIKKHPLAGREILRPVIFEKDAIDIISQHHERFDGKGYPYGLAGNEINILAQILSVADAFDAMTSPRAYRAPLSKSEAIKELKENSGSQFNPEIVNIFLKILEDERHEVLSC
ncbi:MAG: HD domain-containing protein [bacterium]|nr:HD domain-containing protein [bacterium]